MLRSRKLYPEANYIVKSRVSGPSNPWKIEFFTINSSEARKIVRYLKMNGRDTTYEKLNNKKETH